MGKRTIEENKDIYSGSTTKATSNYYNLGQNIKEMEGQSDMSKTPLKRNQRISKMSKGGVSN